MPYVGFELSPRQAEWMIITSPAQAIINQRETASLHIQMKVEEDITAKGFRNKLLWHRDLG